MIIIDQAQIEIIGNGRYVWLNPKQIVNGETPIVIRKKLYFGVTYLQEVVEVREHNGKMFYKIRIE